MMGFSPLANMGRRIADGGRSAPRNSAVTGFGIHHNAGVDAYGEASNPNREVSANYWIANDGTIIPNIDETRRAFTSGAAGYPAGAQADHRNITVEVSNSPEGVRNGSWAISDAAMNSLIRLIADVWIRYGLGLVERSASRGLGVHQDWVPTACPGPYVMGHLGHIIDSANQIITQGEDDMFTDEDRALLRQTAQKANASYDALFKETPTSRGSSAGVLKVLGQIEGPIRATYDAQFFEKETSRGTPGGTLVNDRITLAKLDAIIEHFGIEVPGEPEASDAADGAK